ncbi:FHA domain-containing protein [Catenuloplanes sp. NPDC051500]|uniref:FHA domain-containing protein n=1 Tax=Catenuloplanes sp. NPDC051500 TaxID=3363959 RepID=UPI0037ACB633
MASCPKGHESATLDYCDTCGAPMGGASRPAPAPSMEATQPAGLPSAGTVPAAEGTLCPVCGTPKAGRFCEEDGYDFLLAPPVTPPAALPDSQATPTVGTESAPEPPAAGLEVVVGPDRAYFDGVIAQGGEDSGGMTFPRFAAERRFPLTGEKLLIGRLSRSRGVHPDIDLAAAPEDPGVSHTHALLLNEGGKWSIVDLGSANGTYVNDPASAAIPAETPVPLRPGDRVYLGAWTSLTVREAQ